MGPRFTFGEGVAAFSLFFLLTLGTVKIFEIVIWLLEHVRFV